METRREVKISLASSGILATFIALFLLLPYVYSDDTIFLVSENGGTPQSCAGSSGFVLAQNLTDLCDVTIISPSTNQIIVYNGSQWVNVAQTTFNDTTTCTNIGTGTAFVCVEGTNVDLRSILAGAGTSVSNDTDTITITNTAPDNTTCVNVGSGSQVYKDGECNFRTIIGSSDISVTQQADTITVDFNGTLPSGEDTVCSGQSGNYSIIASSTGGDCTFKNLLASSGISLSSNSTHITITNSSPDNTTCTNLGSVGEGVYASGECDFKKLLAGTGISLSSNSTRITITNTLPEATACNNVGTGVQLCSGGNVNMDTLIAGTGISITDTTDDWTIANTGVTSLTSADTNTLTLSSSTGSITATPKMNYLCSATAPSGNTTITCGSFTAKKHLIIDINYEIQTATATFVLRFNSDSGTNYEHRLSTNGGADATSGNQAQIAGMQINTNTGRPHYIHLNCMNLSATEKSCIGDSIEETSGAGNASGRIEIFAKWANTSTQITKVELVRSAGTGTLTSVSNISVWGYD